MLSRLKENFKYHILRIVITGLLLVAVAFLLAWFLNFPVKGTKETFIADRNCVNLEVSQSVFSRSCFGPPSWGYVTFPDRTVKSLVVNSAFWLLCLLGIMIGYRLINQVRKI